MYAASDERAPDAAGFSQLTELEELVDEVAWYEGELARKESAIQLLSEAFAQSSSLNFHAIKALRSYSADLESATPAAALQVPHSPRSAAISVLV